MTVYSTEQQPIYKIEYWNTPFSTLYNNVASNGLRMDVYNVVDGQGATFESMTLNDTTWNAMMTNVALANGRVANTIGYWAGGAPGQHGASRVRQVAYRIRGTVRTAADRAWYNASASFTMKFAVAGSGRMRITVNGTDVLPVGSRKLSEQDFLTRGPTYSSAVSLANGDDVVIYYVQDLESWGGFVVKPVIPEADGTYLLSTYQESPVLGSGLLSYLTAPALQELGEILSVDVEIVPNQARRASFRVPLITTDTYDGVGWEWQRTNDVTGFLRLRRILQADVDVRRQRLVRISMGYKSLSSGVSDFTPVFTGYIDDFAVRDGIATVTCLGFEQRLADQYVKNYPDRISYMSYGYMRLGGTLEPVYNITAYDNWPIEYAFRDLVTRAGIDEARMRAPVKVRQASGVPVAVSM